MSRTSSALPRRSCGSPEDIDPAGDLFDPEFAPVEFDDEAMAEGAAQLAEGDMPDSEDFEQ